MQQPQQQRSLRWWCGSSKHSPRILGATHEHQLACSNDPDALLASDAEALHTTVVKK